MDIHPHKQSCTIKHFLEIYMTIYSTEELIKERETKFNLILESKNVVSLRNLRLGKKFMLSIIFQFLILKFDVQLHHQPY